MTLLCALSVHMPGTAGPVHKCCKRMVQTCTGHPVSPVPRTPRPLANTHPRGLTPPCPFGAESARPRPAGSFPRPH